VVLNGAVPPGYDPDHFQALFAVEDRHFWFGVRNLALETLIKGLAPHLPPHYHVLEIGCGTGYALRMLKEACSAAAVVVGIDAFEEGLAYARRRTNVPLVRARIEQPPFIAPFDLIGMFDVLEHIEDDVAALREIRALTKPGSYLVLTVPADMALWSRFDEESRHCRRYGPQELRDRLTGAGFDVEYLTPFMAMLYPVARISRWLSGRAQDLRRRLKMAPKSVVLSDLTVWPVINGLVGVILRQEVRVLRKRGTLPIGTSLVAVARAA
jgi:SAM-dependent methyltransferase